MLNLTLNFTKIRTHKTRQYQVHDFQLVIFPFYLIVTPQLNECQTLQKETQ